MSDRERLTKQIWEDTQAVSRYLETHLPEDVFMQAHWNKVVQAVNLGILSFEREERLGRECARLEQALKEKNEEAAALHAIAVLEPQGKQVLLLRRTLGKVRHHAKLLEQASALCQEYLWEAVEGAYLREQQKETAEEQKEELVK